MINLNIVDARPYLYALANRMNGKGFEDVKNYKNCELEFMEIGHIHDARDAHRKLMNLCLRYFNLALFYRSDVFF